MNETQNNRRDFFKEAGKRALWAAPTITLLMTASSQPARATDKASGTQTYRYSGSAKSNKKPEKKLKFFGSGGKSSKSSKKK